MDGRKEDNLSFLRGGYYVYSNGALGSRGDEGSYWEPKDYSDTGIQRLRLNLSSLLPQTSGVKGNGYTIRCVVKP